MKRLTKKQAGTLLNIRINPHSSLAELAVKAGITTRAVSDRVNALVWKGHLLDNLYKHRSLRLTDQGKAAVKQLGVIESTGEIFEVMILQIQ